MKKYVFKPYSKIFPLLFEKEKQRLALYLKGDFKIEHVGSTAVSQLGGKGIIDIAIAVDKKEMDSISKQLQELGYEFRPSTQRAQFLPFRLRQNPYNRRSQVDSYWINTDQLAKPAVVDSTELSRQPKRQKLCSLSTNFSTPDRLYFIIYLPDPEEGKRRYHIHLTYPESQDWKDLIFLRDYLRNHPEEAKKYGELKEKAANESNEVGEKYRMLKGPLIREILERNTD